jgi:hypothetical protein
MSSMPWERSAIAGPNKVWELDFHLRFQLHGLLRVLVRKLLSGRSSEWRKSIYGRWGWPRGWSVEVFPSEEVFFLVLRPGQLRRFLQRIFQRLCRMMLPLRLMVFLRCSRSAATFIRRGGHPPILGCRKIRGLIPHRGLGSDLDFNTRRV